MADADVTPPEDLGPGGQGTPTPEPGPTPTPQEPELKPAAQLLAEEGAEAAAEPEVPAAPAVPVETEDARRSRTAADRIKELVVEKSSERRAREAAEARARLAEETLAEIGRLDPEIAQRLQQGAGQGTPTTPSAAPQTFTRAQVEQAAAALASQAQFNQQVDAAVIAGRAQHPDFDAAVAGLKALTGPQGPSTEFIQAALATGEAPELIYRLGKDPAEADRLLSLPPAALGAQMERLAATMRGEKAAAAKPPEPTRAPPAIAPRVTGRGATSELALDDPKLPMAEYIKRRNEHEKRLRASA